MSGSLVRVAVADPSEAAGHFARRLQFETDCADVHTDLERRATGIVVVDARSVTAFASGHVPGAVSLPHAMISAESTAAFPRDAVLVTYCWGPHCNGATRAAATLAALGFRVKEMVGGIAGWRAEGFAIVAVPNGKSRAEVRRFDAPT